MPRQTLPRRLTAALLAAGLALPACNRNRPAETGDAGSGESKPADGPKPYGGANPDTGSGTKAPDWVSGLAGAVAGAGKADKPEKPASPWAATAIPLGSSVPVTFGPAGCPVLVVAQEVYDARTYKPLRKLAEPYDRQALHALSADGKFFASGSKSPNQTQTDVAVWSTETGQRVLDVPGQKDAYVDVLTFAGPNLMLGGRHNKTIEAWDVAAKKVATKLTVPGRRVEAKDITFSPDGRRMAAIDHDKLAVVDTATGKPAATAAPPGKAIGQPGQSGSPDAIFVYASADALTFSADGTELAMYSRSPSPRLIVWDAKGRMVVDQPVPTPQFIGHRTSLEWVPDGGGWLLNGHLIDRASGRAVVSMRVPFGSETLPHLLDRDRVIGLFGDDRDRLQTITLPWEKLNASLKALAAKADAYVRPGDTVSLQIDLTGLRGDEAQTRKLLADAITARLARDGIGVAADRPTVLWLKLSEQAGETLPIYERQSPFDLRGRDTGRKATEAKGAAVLELWAQGENRPLWRGHLTATSSRSFSEEITDATVRKSMLEHLGSQLGGMDVPYFIPKAKDVVALPAVVE